MRILYGIQGTGNGHISRSRMIAKQFQQRQTEVQYLFSGRQPEQLFDMEMFNDYWHRDGLTFATHDGRVDYLKSAFKNNLPRFIHDVFTLPVQDFDLIITDFEPVTAWAAKLRNKPVIGIGHQYAFGKNTPVCGENFIARQVMKNFAPAQKSAGLHWHAFDNGILPPIVDTTLQSNKDGDDNIIVVYLPFEDQAQVTRMLQQFDGRQFIQYSSELVDAEQGNVSLRKACYQGFTRDLCRAGGVICNSGFELVSECLHLGIPILTKPTQGQMEQLSNALALQQLALAMVMNTLCSDTMARWLHTLDSGEASKAKALPNVAEALVEWILSGEHHNVDVLSNNLWQQYHSS